MQALSQAQRPAPFSHASTQQRHRQQQHRRRLAPVRAEQQQSNSSEAAGEPAVAAPPCDACPTCGAALADKPSGCDGTGRIMGGLGAVPGFGWCPIKAYRPCPKLNEAGIRYQRKGQVTDEVLFGRDKQ